MVMMIMCLILASSIFISNSWSQVSPPPDLQAVDRNALIAFKNAKTVDGGDCLQTWDPTQDKACGWVQVTCEWNNRVTRIDLGGCNIAGSLVPDLGNLTMLNYMNFYQNVLTGGIPPELGNLANLKTLDLSTNALTGGIPPELGNLTSLTHLRLQDNFLDGPIPNELGKLKNLIVLELQDNNLNGTVPTDLENNFKNMPLVNLTNNKGPGGQGGLSGNCTEKACCNHSECLS